MKCMNLYTQLIVFVDIVGREGDLLIILRVVGIRTFDFAPLQIRDGAHPIFAGPGSQASVWQVSEEVTCISMILFNRKPIHHVPYR